MIIAGGLAWKAEATTLTGVGPTVSGFFMALPEEDLVTIRLVDDDQ
jgi:hypothetical protein